MFSKNTETAKNPTERHGARKMSSDSSEDEVEPNENTKGKLHYFSHITITNQTIFQHLNRANEVETSNWAAGRSHGKNYTARAR
jgi:hypothetical protein